MQVSCSLEALGSRTGIPKGLKKMPNSGGERGLVILEFGGHGGMNILEFPRARGGGLKILMPLVVGYGYFLESPNDIVTLPVIFTVSL